MKTLKNPVMEQSDGLVLSLKIPSKTLEFLQTGFHQFLKVMMNVSRKKILFHLIQSKLSLHAVISLVIATLLQSTKRLLRTLQIFLFQFHVAH